MLGLLKKFRKGIKKNIIKNITITDKITEKKCSTLEFKYQIGI